MSTNKARQAALAIQQEADERVAAGIALLDERAPDWRSRINLETLDIRSGGYCTLAQVFGDFNRGRHHLELGRPADYGFFLRDHDDLTYPDLTAAWKRVLA